MNKDITPLNNKGQRHGYWELYLDYNIWYKRFYHNGKLIGYEENHIYRVFPNKGMNKIYYLR